MDINLSSLKQEMDTPDQVEYDIIIKWLSEENIRKISQYLWEPQRMLEHRLKSYKIFLELPMPKWGPDLSKINFDEIVYFAKIKDIDKYKTSWDEVPDEIKKTYEKLGIPEAEAKYLAGAWGQFDAEMVYHRIQQRRADKGVIFEDMNEAVKKYPDLVKKYFMKLIPPSDHKFAALHGAVWSWWTFIYIPKGVKVDQPLQAYFRMNIAWGGQFEHTLIILEDDTRGDYIEGCSAPIYRQISIHAGGVEIYVGKNSHMRYSSVENWSRNTYNLNTKRALVEENSYMEWIGGNLGSGVTMLYPASILKWDNSKADHIGVAVATKDQYQDVGSKVIHIGKNTSSTIVSKSISKDWWISVYRGLVEIRPSAQGAVNSTECDALLLDDKSVSDTIPTIKVNNPTWVVAHEASAWKVDEDKLFYMMSRGLDEEHAMAMIVNGFISPVVKKLPLEYAGELNRLIEMEMEWSVG